MWGSLRLYARYPAKKFIKTSGYLGQAEVRRPKDQLSTDPRILVEVADVFEVQVDTLLELKKGRGRQNTPRKIAMYIAQKHSDYRLKEITEVFGLAHYGGVSNAIHNVSEVLKVDDALFKRVNSIIKRFDP